MAIIREPLKHDPESGQWVPSGERSVTYEGRVLRVYKRDYRAMSDVYTLATFATVVEPDGTIEEVLVNANFECDVGGGHAQVDATPECLAAKAAHDAKLEAARRARDEADRARRAEEEKNRPVKGKKMVVARGRKVPLGTVGTVAYVSGSGSVLLKADHEWQDRKAQGTWVDARNLKAR